MILGSVIELGADELTPGQADKLLRTLTFYDADDIEVQAYDYYDGRRTFRLPRGVLNLLPAGLDIEDNRVLPSMPKIAFIKSLDAEGYEGQTDAVRAMFEHEQGQVIAPPGRGKTEICLAFAAAAKTRTLVVVHTQDLFRQWVDRCAESIPNCSVGKIQGGACQVEHVTIAMAPTLRRYIRDHDKFWQQFGCVIIDEAHHAAADTWAWLLNVCPAHYRFGVTASEKRSDGRQPLVKFNIGPVIYKLAFSSQVPILVKPVKTSFRSQYNGSQYNRILRELVRDDDRNMLIAKITEREIGAGHAVLVLSRQIVHLEGIYEAMGDEYKAGERAVMVTGRLGRRERARLIEQLRDGTTNCILGTQLFEEGVNIPRLNRIVLAFPGTEITVLQKVGRGARKFAGKTETIVYDILDDKVRVLARQYLKRRAWYRSVGIQVVTWKGKVIGNGIHSKKQAQGKGRFHGVLEVARPRRTR